VALLSQLGDALLLRREAEDKAQQLEQELVQTRATANQALQQLLSGPQNGHTLHPLNNLANQQVCRTSPACGKAVC